MTSSTPAMLTSIGGGNFGGVIGGDLSFTRSGNNTTLLTSPQTYTGTTTIRGGVLQLRDGATLASTAGINNFFGTLNIDNSGFTNLNNGDRVPNGSAIMLQGGTLTLNRRSRADLHGNRGRSDARGRCQFGWFEHHRRHRRQHRDRPP